jgi:acetyltransferase-like isoleucine patch superfamily enzyme
MERFEGRAQSCRGIDGREGRPGKLPSERPPAHPLRLPETAAGGGGLRAALARYQELAVGERGLGRLLLHELLLGLLGPLPGLPGLFLRQKLYRALLGTAGKGLLIGRSVSLRNPRRVHLERGVALDEGVMLAALGVGSGIRIGEGTIIAARSILNARGGTIEIGAGGSVGPACRIGTSSRIVIGRWALFAHGCDIGGEDHPWDDPAVPMALRPALPRGGVTIGDDVWLGTRAIVLDGVTIGRGAIIGAASLVTRDIPEMAIAFGIPARVVRYRDGRPATPDARAAEAPPP